MLAADGRAAAEHIAAVVADIRAGRVTHPAAVDDAGIVTSLQLLTRAQVPQPVVDCTPVFRSLDGAPPEVNPYDEYPEVTPPWDNAMLGFINSFGNVFVLQVHRRDHTGGRPKGWRTPNHVDWSTVRWVAETAVWVGGRDGTGRPVTTSGPCHLFRHAINPDGAPADINWVSLMERRTPNTPADAPQLDLWQMPMVVLCAALNFLNCRNIEVGDPRHTRVVRRRLDRAGHNVDVQAIIVRPPGKHRPTDPGTVADEHTFATIGPVRGSMAHYGPRYGRGLLFGKYEGKVWRPAHVRGPRTPGTEPVVRDYELRPRR